MDSPLAAVSDAMSVGLVGLQEIRAAKRRIRSVAITTPLLPWDSSTFLKPENLQLTGSFKIRGAYNKLASLSRSDRRRGVVAYSSGNHAQAVARAARLLQIDAVIVMPEHAPETKVAGVILDGAKLVRVGTGSHERRQKAEEIAAETGRLLVPPYDDPVIIAGQGTIGLELLAQTDRLSSVLVPIGGGGLCSGIAAAVKAVRPEVRIIGVEPEAAADAKESLAAGRLSSWPSERTKRTIADGLRTQSLSELTFAHIHQLVDEIVTVTNEQIAGAVGLLAERNRLVVEPSGAVGLAAHLGGGLDQDIGRVIVITGGNVDRETFASLLTSASLGEAVITD